MLYIHFTVLARGGRRPVNILKKGIGDYENKYKADFLKKKKEQTGKNTTEIFKSAIYFTGVDETFVDNLISNIGVLASNNDIEGIKEEVQRYVAYRTCQK